MTKRWPAEHLELLHRLYPVMDTRELAAMLGRNPKLVRCQAKNYGLTKAQKRRFWTPAEVRELRELYPNTPTKQLAERFGRGVWDIYRKAAGLGLEKTAEYLASPAACRLRRRTDGGEHVGARTCFKKGHVPANKGLRRPGWFRGRMRETQFKKGQMNGAAQHNYVPIGTTRISKDGYLERKFTDDPSRHPTYRWKGVHRLVWEAAHGPVPPGHAVCFLPGRRTIDPEKITLDALELVTRAELMRRNTCHRYGKEIARAIQLRGAINRQINKRMKREDENRRPA